MVRRVAWRIGVMAVGLMLIAGAAWAQEQAQWGVFSWQSRDVRGCEDFFDVLDEAGATEVYQYFTSSLDDDDVLDYLQEAAKHSVTVYALAGEPSWVTDEEHDGLRKITRRVRQWNEELPEEARIRGLVLDVEPYQLDEWDDKPKRVMKQYVAAMTYAADYLKERDLACILCIPYFYDEIGRKAQLKKLFALDVSAIAVMNYYKRDEAGQMATEARLAKKNNRQLIHIYEMQAPEKHNLRDVNTYHAEGLEGVRDSWEKLSPLMPGARYAIHEFAALKEALEDE